MPGWYKKFRAIFFQQVFHTKNVQFSRKKNANISSSIEPTKLNYYTLERYSYTRARFGENFIEQVC